MSITSSSSKVCRHLWIKRFCYDIIKAQHGRSVTVAAKQVNQTAHINYSSTPTNLSFVKNTKTIPNNHCTTRKNLEKAVLDHVKANQFNDARRLLTEYYNNTGKAPSIEAYNDIIKGLAKQFQYDYRQHEAHALLEDMTQHGVLPNSQTYMQMLLGYAVHTNNRTSSITTTTSSLEILRKMKQLLYLLLQSEFQHESKKTHLILKKLIRVMEGSGHIAILPTMITTLKAGIKLDIHVWNNALNGCIRGGYLDSGEQLLEIMRTALQKKKENQQQQQQKKNDIIPIPNTTSYHIIINGYLGQGNSLNRSLYTVNMDKSIELFQKMMDDGIIADYPIYQSFIYAYASSSSSTSSEQPSQQNKNNNNNNNNNNNDNNITKIKVDPLETLQKLWQAMITTLTEDHKLNDHFLSTLLDYYIKHQGYSAIEQVYWDLRHHKYKISRRLIGYFNEAIIGCARQQHLLSGIAMFYDMLTHGYGASNAVVLSLLRACIYRCQLDISEQILQIMEETLQKPASIHQYTLLIHGFVHQGQIEAANRLFTRLLQYYQHEEALNSLSSAYTYMIQGYFKLSQINEAESLFYQYKKLQFKRALKEKRKHEYKYNYYKHNNTEIYASNRRLINAMIEGYGLSGQHEKLNAFFVQNGIKKYKDLETLTTLIQAKLQYGDINSAESHLKIAMKHYDVRDLQPLVEKVLVSFALDGNTIACEHWANLLTSKNRTSPLLFESLLLCYGKSGNFEKLKELYQQVNEDKKIILETGIYNKINNEWLKNCT